VLSTLEATAPCRLELIGGPLDGAAGAGLDGVLRLAVALDRRVFCRVEPRDSGLEVHSKDTGERVVAHDAREIAVGPAAPVARILEVAGVRFGVRVVTQVRVPGDAGLGANGALEVAVLAALGQSGAEILGRVPAAVGSEEQIAESDRHAAVSGGAHVLRVRRGTASVERVAVDPARLEECLLLVDPGSQASLVPSRPPDAGTSERALEALGAGAYDDVAAILADVHRGRFDSAPPVVGALALSIERLGGAAWPCGRLVAVWAAPGARSGGPREAVSSALKDAGLRSFPVRVDLRGLEVE
jgi:hypothetical protein